MDIVHIDRFAVLVQFRAVNLGQLIFDLLAPDLKTWFPSSRAHPLYPGEVTKADERVLRQIAKWAKIQLNFTEQNSYSNPYLSRF